LMQAAKERRQSFARRLSWANSTSSEMSASTRSAARNLRSSKKIFSNGLIARWPPRRPRRNLRASQIASGQGRLRLNCRAQRGRLPICKIYRCGEKGPNGKKKAAKRGTLATLRSFALAAKENHTNKCPPATPPHHDGRLKN